MNGILNLLKPPGLSSAQAVSAVKRLAGTKAGHGGTLDPEAAGVLPVLLGRATRLFDYLRALPKTYLAEIAFGAATDTQDAQGHVLEQGGRIPDGESFRRALEGFRGPLLQRPSRYSALKVNGVPMYRLARSGQSAQAAPRQVEILDIGAVTSLSEDSFLFRTVCSSGTYIRALCEDIGRALDCPAHMRFLLRESVGCFHLGEALTLEEVRAQAAAPQGLAPRLHAMDSLFPDLPALSLSVALARRFVSGAVLEIMETLHGAGIPETGRLRLYAQGVFLGVGRVADGRCSAEIVLGQAEGQA